MRRLSVPALLAVVALLAGCGGKSKLTVVHDHVTVTSRAPSTSSAPAPPETQNSSGPSRPVPKLGIPILATNNTTRINGTDPIEDAAAVAQAVYPGLTPSSRPVTVTVAPTDDWQAALASSVLMAAPLRSPILLSGSGSLPSEAASALSAMHPQGSGTIRGAQVIRIGDAPSAAGYRTASITGAGPFALAAAIDAFQTAAAGRPSSSVIVASANAPTYAMPAAAYAAESGDPILYVTATSVPEATRQAILAHGRPHIYVIGPKSVIPHAITKVLDALGRVRRVDGTDPIANAVAFSRYRDPPCPLGSGCVPGEGSFGWAVTSGGHGYVFANIDQPLAAAAAAPLSGSGTYGPMLLVNGNGTLPSDDTNDLLDNASGYNQEGPTAAVFNHGWIIGNQSAVSAVSQAEIDSLLNVFPAK